MDVQTVTTSLDALLHRATSAESNELDLLAIEAFCTVLKNQQDGPYIASRLIASKMHSDNPKVALLALQVLEIAMKKGGNSFQTEIGKFKFLNEMVKLVSPKYLGNNTSQAVKDKVLLLMHTWIFDYPKEIKIKEAYLMLQKQGVTKNDIPTFLHESAEQINKNVHSSKKSQTHNKIVNYEDEEKSKLLKKLLQSKNPEDIQTANRLIKNMVREDEKRMELIQHKRSEINSVNNNINLLNEMLDQYKPAVSSEDELQLIRDVYTHCKELQPKINRIAQETQDQDDILCEVLQASDELLQVFNKYKSIFENRKDELSNDNGNASLLDLDVSQSSENKSPHTDNNLPISSHINQTDELLDIFSSVESNFQNVDGLLKPLNLQETNQDEVNGLNVKAVSAMDELNLLGENLLKENLLDGTRAPSFMRSSEKVPMNSLLKTKDEAEPIKSCFKDNNLDLNILIGDCLKSRSSEKDFDIKSNENISEDDLMIDMSESKVQSCGK